MELTREKAETLFGKILEDEVTNAIERASGKQDSSIKTRRSGRPSAVFLGIGRTLLHKKDFQECVRVLLGVKDDVKEWLTTEEAAKLIGFSRPFTAELLDGPSFLGKVTRTESGHRRVKRVDIEAWLISSQEGPTPSQAEVRAESWRNREPSKLPSEKENAVFKEARSRSLVRAKKLGLS